MPESRFTGKQVFGLVVASVLLLAVGLAVGGVVGYRLGQAEGSRQAPGESSTAPQAQVPGRQNPGSGDLTSPFDNLTPGLLQGGGPYLGVEFEMITPQVAASEALTGTTGALIRSVVSDSPAAKAGLQAGDVITAVDGQAVDEQNDLRSRIQDYKAGDEVTLTVVKGTASGPANSHAVKLTLGEQPGTQGFNFNLPPGHPAIPMPFNGQNQPQVPQSAAGGPYLGVEFEMITPDVAAREGITGTTGALIQTVIADSPAAAAGLKKGEVVTAVNNMTVDDQHSLRDLVQGYQVGDTITLTVVTATANGPTGAHDVKVTLAAPPAERQWQMPPGTLPGDSSPDSQTG
jgi:membrane-associated protease RseP (regulator of RpoE activity)